MERTVAAPGPLNGVVVLDFTQVEMGPCATQTLGDFGADVIKVERPPSGDLARVHMRGPSGESAVFWSLNRNKRSVALDVRTPLGREAINRLATRADVLVHNFRPGVMERLGFGPEELRKINPRLIYAMGSGYGSDGPYRDKGGQDVLAQAISGIAARRPNPSDPPEPMATAIADFTAGMLLVQGILMALMARERTGKGQVVDVSLLDGMLAMQMQEATVWLSLRQRLNWGAMPLSGTFQTRDGHREISRGLGIEDLSADPRYATHEDQVAHRDDLQARFREEFRKLTTDEAVQALEAVDILVSRVNTLEDALDDPQVAHNEMIVEMRHPDYGLVRTVGIPIKMRDTPGSLRLPPPRLGEHTAEVLEELGFSAGEIAEMLSPASEARSR